MEKFKVGFDVPDAGWILMTLEYAGRVLTVNASHVYDSFPPLVSALTVLAAGPDEATVVWQCEPAEYQFDFVRKGNTVALQIQSHQDSCRSVFDVREPELSITGSYEEICLPFWRALRHLQGLFSDEEWNNRWQRPFPSAELNRLTAAIGKS